MDVDSAGPLDGLLKIAGIIAILLVVLGAGLWFFNRPSTGFVSLSAQEGIMSDSPLDSILGSPSADKARQIVLSQRPVQLKLFLDSFEWEVADANISLQGEIDARQGTDQSLEAGPGLTRLTAFSGTIRWNAPDLFLTGQGKSLEREGLKLQFLSNQDLTLKAPHAQAFMEFTAIDSMKKIAIGGLSSRGVSIDLNGTPLELSGFKGSVRFEDNAMILDGNVEKIILPQEG